MARVMIAGTSSGCGKTTITCAILQALVNRKKKTASFKCGPDYIDPMFHSRIIGTKSRNLDGYFMDRQTLNYLLEKNSRGMEISVIEGVMGYYDGIGMEDTASSYAVARDTKTPVILVLPCRGMSRCVQAMLKGYLEYMPDSGIEGVIFNQLPSSLYPAMQEYCKEVGIKAFGYFPKVPEAEIGSRHLGLITADEIVGLQEKMQCLAEAAEHYLDMEEILRLAESAESIRERGIFTEKKSGSPVRIAVAEDEAFCFYYEDNFLLLRELGAELVPFSPLRDRHLPQEIDGLLLGGGYPELYAGQLQENMELRREIRERIVSGLPTHAECGGFMYLHDTIRTPQGEAFEMAGVLSGECHFTSRLQHFGYSMMTADKDNLLCKKGDCIPVHEFHRCQSTVEQDAFVSRKNQQTWNSYISKYRLAAGFPHIHYFANPSVGENFYKACLEYQGIWKGNS